MKRAISRLVAMDRVEAFACFLAALFVFLASFAPIAIAMTVAPEDLDAGRVRVGAPCSLRARGQSCGTCGLTRGFAALARGRVDDARRYNPRAPILFGACAALAGAATLVMAAAACALLKSESQSRTPHTRARASRSPSG